MVRPFRSRAASGLAFGFIAVGCAGVIGSWGAYLMDTGIARDGALAEARIIGKDFLHAADGDSDYIVEYTFTLPDGERLVAHRSIDKALWNTLAQGQVIDVHYAPENPTRNFPRGGGVTSLGLTVFVSVLFAVLAAFGGIIGWVHTRRA